ncbi:MAG: hypothetical protein GY713_15835 [Actinomycetia bacterium]|nr:hypothetical protein [Actinomycetes bacterium]
MESRWRLCFRWLVLTVTVVVLAVGCSSGDDEGTEPTTTSGADEVASGEGTDDEQPESQQSSAGSAAGDLIEATEVTIGGLEAWTVRYLSTGIGGDLVEVTGVVLAPEGGASGADVVAWTHGTTGVADACAPSAPPPTASPAAISLAQAGYVVAVTDYEGLGTEGTHPYLIGESEARSAIDIVRAVGQMGLEVSDGYAVAGLSQGGHAALWTGQLASAYAPEIELVGVVAAAPAANIASLMQTIGSPAQGFAVMSAVALDAVYDDVILADYFTPEAIEAMDVVHTGCNAEVFAAFLDIDYDTMVVPGAWDGRQPIGPLAERLAENEAGRTDIAAPVLLVQGDVDAIVRQEFVEALHDDYCAMNTNAEYSLYIGGGHGDTIITAMDDVVVWLNDRFDGVAPVDGCSVVDPDLAAIRAAELTEPAIDGVLFDGVTPDGYDTLVSDTTGPRLETCPGTPIFGGRVPVAYSASVWVVEIGLGPFLDGFVARFESEEEAAAAIQAFDAELVECGRFTDPTTTAEGSFSRSIDPGLGDESYGHEFSGDLAGFPVSRVSYTARVGDTIYSSSQSQGFVAAEPEVVLEALGAILP